MTPALEDGIGEVDVGVVVDGLGHKVNLVGELGAGEVHHATEAGVPEVRRGERRVVEVRVGGEMHALEDDVLFEVFGLALEGHPAEHGRLLEAGCREVGVTVEPRLVEVGLASEHGLDEVGIGVEPGFLEHRVAVERRPFEGHVSKLRGPEVCVRMERRVREPGVILESTGAPLKHGPPEDSFPLENTVGKRDILSEACLVEVHLPPKGGIHKGGVAVKVDFLEACTAAEGAAFEAGEPEGSLLEVRGRLERRTVETGVVGQLVGDARERRRPERRLAFERRVVEAGVVGEGGLVQPDRGCERRSSEVGVAIEARFESVDLPG